MERIYSAIIWAQQVKKLSNFACMQCGSFEDVQATHRIPPSLGGKNTLENGVALCLQCRSKKVLDTNRTRLNFSIPESLSKNLNEYCKQSGRSTNDVVKQLLADFLFDSEVHLNGFHRNGERNFKRISVPVLSSVFGQFSEKCKKLEISPGDAMKSMLFRYVKTYGGDAK